MSPTEAQGERRGGARVEARELTRRFGARIAVDRLSLAIEPGETFGLLGANGAGKTTFIRMVTGYLLPSSGTIQVDGISPTTDARAVHARLGFAAETSCLYPELRVQGFLRFAGEVRGLSGEALRRGIERVVDRFDLGAVTGRLVGHLSKGYQQRVSLAQAFLHEPELLIVDEPSSGLDPLQQREVQGILEQSRGQRTVLLCTHDLEEARRLADRVGVLHAGRLAACGPTDEVLGDGDALALFHARTEGSA